MARTAFPPGLGRRQQLKGWEQDLVLAIKGDDLARLQSAVGDSIDSVAKAWDELNSFVAQSQELEQRKRDIQRDFPPPFIGFPQLASPDGLTAMIPLFGAQAYLNVGARRLAAMYVLYGELALVFTDIGNGFLRAGFAPEATRVRAAAQLLRDWQHGVDQQAVPLSSVLSDEYEAINARVNSALSSAGLQRIQDDDKPGYFDVLKSVLDQYTAEPSADIAPPAEMQGARLSGATLGLDPLTVAAIYKLVGIVVIVGGIIAAIAIVSKIVSNYFGAANAAMDAARQIQVRKTTREQEAAAEIQSNEQAVQDGTMTRTEADQRNSQVRQETDRRNADDSQQFKKEVEAASAAAANAGPGLGTALLWGGIIAGGLFAGYTGLKLLKVI